MEEGKTAGTLSLTAGVGPLLGMLVAQATEQVLETTADPDEKLEDIFAWECWDWRQCAGRNTRWSGSG